MNTNKMVEIAAVLMAKTEVFGWVSPMNATVHAEAWAIAQEAARILGYENIPGEMPRVEAVGAELLGRGFLAGYFFNDATIKVVSADWLRVPAKTIMGIMAHEFLHAIQVHNGLCEKDVKTGFEYAQSRHEREAYGVSYALGVAGTKAWMPVFMAARKGSQGFMAYMANVASSVGMKEEVGDWLELNIAPFIKEDKLPSLKEGFGLAKGFVGRVRACYKTAKNFDYSF